MSRDHRKLRVFRNADRAVEIAYKATQDFPSSERFGLQAQVRRAAVSVPSNIVEGCARRSSPEYLHFLNIAVGSAAETAYLVGLSHRLGYLKSRDLEPLAEAYGQIQGELKALMNALENRSSE